MSKLISALKRTIVGAPDGEAPVHFHQGMTDSFPEVCHDGRLRASARLSGLLTARLQVRS